MGDLVKEKKMYNILDLFAGAGGLSLGFVQQGNFNIVGVIENNENALMTYQKNHSSDDFMIERDIRTVDFKSFREKIGNVDVIIGGPPCQGFSNANRQKTKFISMNNALVKRYLDAVIDIQPQAFVMENVAMLKSDVHKFFDSNIDHDEVKKLGIKMKNEASVIMNQNPDGDQMIEVLKNKKTVNYYSMEESLFNSVKVVKRYLGKEKKLNSYFSKYSTSVIRGLSEYEQKLGSDIIGQMVKSFIDVLLSNYNKREVTADFKEKLDKLIEFERAISLMKELHDNQVIFDLSEKEDGKIEVELQSYTVFDYINKRIKNNYNVTYGVLNAADFGAPQERHRFIMIGIRSDIINKKVVEMPFHEEVVKHTVRDAIYDLEKYVPCKSVNDSPISRKEFSKNNFTKALQDGKKNIYNHVNTDTRATAMNRFAKIKQGKNFHSLDASMKEDTYSDPTRTQNTIYLRLDYDKPCGTVVNVRKSMWIHPTKNRAISIREAARLQTFPDSYIFYGSKDSQYQQIGNAVPPILSKAIANKIVDLLCEEE
ncbi:MAG: DNA cytosine methyltransferase [Christensenellaceae bacterium]